MRGRRGTRNLLNGLLLPNKFDGSGEWIGLGSGDSPRSSPRPERPYDRAIGKVLRVPSQERPRSVPLKDVAAGDGRNGPNSSRKNSTNQMPASLAGSERDRRHPRRRP